ncbi:isochorismatase family cysteine hydrolase [Schleiferilactobacillus harbinensis]|uniref:Cysteine hydrolase n=1 Tax=Schleiferilactobacillus harbinensis TaxID=304207 RepID=A0ABU7T0L5_9LACO
MAHTNEALLIIDYTNDFVADKGALTCGAPGQKLAANIIALADEFRDQDGWVYLPTDVHTPHDPYHPESKLFPPHNVRNTWGREFYGPLKPWYAAHQAAERVTMFDKTRYSAFAGTALDLRLRERKIDTVHLVGVCTDICVLHTAVDAYNLNYQIVVHQNAVAALTPAGQDWALGHFAHVLGAQVTD